MVKLLEFFKLGAERVKTSPLYSLSISMISVNSIASNTVLVHKVKNKWMKVSIRPHSESVCTGVTVEILLYKEYPQGIHK